MSPAIIMVSQAINKGSFSAPVLVTLWQNFPNVHMTSRFISPMTPHLILITLAGPQITMEIIHQIKKIFVVKLIIIQKVKTLIFHCERKANPVKDNTETVPRRLLQKRCSANLDQISRRITMHCVKNIQIRSFFGPYFPAFELNTGK